jgi:ATP-binding cassette subfamily C protein
MKRRNGFTVMARLIALVKPLAGFMVLAIIMGLIGHLCAAFITIFGGYAVLQLLHFDTPLGLTALFIAVGVFALVRGILRYAEQACNHFIAFKLLALIRDKVFQALRKLCPAKLEGRDKGDLISVITSDIELLEVFYAHTISPAAIAFLFTIMLCLFIGSYHWVLGLLAFAAYITVGIFIPLATSKLSGDNGMRFRTKSGNLSSFVLDSLRGLSETIQYGQGDARLCEMNQKTDALAKEEARMKRTAGRNMAVTNTVILIFDLAMLFVSAVLYQNGTVDFSGVLIPTIALMSSFGPCVALANLGSTLQNTFAAGNRVLDILDESPVVDEVTGKTNIRFHGASAEHVTFSYGTETILDDVSLQIPEGSVVGIVGRSGSGKSTLLKLFMRFWNIQKGAVKISDRSVSEINTANLRDMESFVTQETHLFHDSIRNNLRIANLEATDEEIEEACKKASVHDFILSLPQGYDTSVGELGDTLSGGERQRLGLARAFLHNAPFMLLDEPTSNLDSLNEAVILKSLREERENKTVVLVSHRLSTMRIADTVYSVESLSKTGGRMS